MVQMLEPLQLARLPKAYLAQVVASGHNEGNVLDSLCEAQRLPCEVARHLLTCRAGCSTGISSTEPAPSSAIVFDLLAEFTGPCVS